MLLNVISGVEHLDVAFISLKAWKRVSCGIEACIV